MDHIRELRRLVGHRPLIAVGSSVIVRRDDGDVLLLRRADTGDWGLPGGLMEPGESVEQTALREVAEEIGVTLTGLDFFDVFSGAEYFFRYPNGDEIYNVTVVYLARLPRGVPLVLDAREVSAAMFFPVTGLPEDVLPPERPILARYGSF